MYSVRYGFDVLYCTVQDHIITPLGLSTTFIQRALTFAVFSTSPMLRAHELSLPPTTEMLLTLQDGCSWICIIARLHDYGCLTLFCHSAAGQFCTFSLVNARSVGSNVIALIPYHEIEHNHVKTCVQVSLKYIHLVPIVVHLRSCTTEIPGSGMLLLFSALRSQSAVVC